MAFSSLSSASVSLLLISSFFLLGVSEVHSESSHHLVKGMSWSFYKSKCPEVESIVRKHLKKVFKKDIGVAAGLLRLHFHDCFVLGCDASVLLDGSASGPSEQEDPPNFTLRAKAFQIINDLQALVQEHCDRVVSCADLVALAARDSVFLSGGPDYRVPLGRRDSLNFATREATLANLLPGTSNTTAVLNLMATKKLDATDAVALSGGHTIGVGHCSSFTERLYPTQDPTMDKSFATELKKTCPELNTSATTVLDVRTPNLFDNKYYINLVKREGLFTSDQDLYMDSRTKEIVTSFAEDEELFFEKFVNGMIKMGQLNVLTGKKGEVRANCSAVNSDAYLSTAVDADGDEYDDEQSAEL
ncbi:peroxidase 12-like [Macadamia integrifolia]|uniref:peroxidase 12-like n=1 Tax=Macadamia integrifolia TaxID=60698 RepID=UPI001C4F1B82|nr:peroxidase 12-like [Macadamia integrifolia]